MAVEGKPLEGQVALITGGGRGIGEGITRKLAAWGCKICFTYIDRPKAANALAKELRDNGTDVTVLRMDLSSEEDIQAVMDEIRNRHGRLNILIHNAAATKFTLLKDASMSDWQFVQDTNARSTLLLAQKSIPLLDGQKDARFITITNSTTQRILRRAGLFAAAKAALETMTNYLSYELAPFGIVTNCIRPGLVRTGVFNVRPDFEEGVNHELGITPWSEGRMTTIEDCGDVVGLMCLPEAGWIAGQTITVDGAYKWWGNLRK